MQVSEIQTFPSEHNGQAICLLDLYSRYVVGYVISNTLDTSGCLECLEHATTRHGHPKMLNSDQGSQFTSLAWINKLSQLDIIISMDGKGRWADNVYVERFWRTLKRECIYANGVESVTQLHTEVARYIKYYNQQRLHSSLGYKTPCAVYQKNLEDIRTYALTDIHNYAYATSVILLSLINSGAC